MVFTTEAFLELAIEGWPESDLNPFRSLLWSVATFALSEALHRKSRCIGID